MPWIVDRDGVTIFSSPLEATGLILPAGRYALVYDLLPAFKEGEESYDGRIVLAFVLTDDPPFEIVRQHRGNASSHVVTKRARAAD